MTVVSGYRGRLAPLLLSVLGLLVAQVASAKSGGVDYSWGAGALAKAHDYTVTMMLYVLYGCDAGGSVMAIISALLIYFKMQYHEGEVMKNIMTLIGAVLFIIGASIVFPAFFGYRIEGKYIRLESQRQVHMSGRMPGDENAPEGAITRSHTSKQSN